MRRWLDRMYELHKEVKESYSFPVFCAEFMGYIHDPCFLESTYQLIRSHNLDESFPLRKIVHMPMALKDTDLFNSIALSKKAVQNHYLISTYSVLDSRVDDFVWVSPNQSYANIFSYYNGPYGKTKTFDLLAFEIVKVGEWFLVYEKLGGKGSTWNNLVAVLNDISAIKEAKLC